MKSSEIRQAFFDYFTAKGHQWVESSPLVPANDPTLLFTNAGMVQFKETFLGMEPRSYTRAVSAQRCVRAGGKHNDLENVGYTARHHTFFEMLGNFSFGDYFKRDAIQFAWEFLTEVLELPKEKLWVTVYKEDEETADIWLKEMGVPETRFSRCGEKDNFWSMGDTGPCGPCTEIFYDHGPQIPGGPPGSPDEDGDRYVEVWNLVFMQFNRDKEGKLHPLPKPSVDTGMGLERIAAVVQGVHNNYDIDTFKQIIAAIVAFSPTINTQHPSLKVIADHIRSCAFLIADGVLPSNEGRGYVLRRIIRRAVRHGNKLGLPPTFFSQLVAPLGLVMGETYPELLTSQAHIEKILAQEENQFAKTLEQGLKLLHDQMENLTSNVLPGEVVFKLYDTYGFPLDLTQDIAREQHLTVDIDGFERSMQQQREQSQLTHQFSNQNLAQFQLNEISTFHGYDEDNISSNITVLLRDGKQVETIKAGDKAAVVLDHTPFYAESGGQVGDKGTLIAGKAVFKVEDTQKVGQAIIHQGELLSGELSLGNTIEAQIDSSRRAAIRLNHTATHLLHAALKKRVGEHVQQKGSLVDAERARFDFSHYEALTSDELTDVETIVNQQIRANHRVLTELMSLEKAKKSGAMALFGEKYAEEVRVLSLGDFSTELCGGTHAARTGDIGLFKIIAEYGVASGIRRIELVTGEHAFKWMTQQLSQLDEIAKKLKTNPDNATEKLSQLLAEAKQNEKELSRLQAKLAAKSSQDLISDALSIGESRVLIKHLEGADSQTLRTTLDQLKSTLNQAVIVLYAISDGKINVVAGISKTLIGKVPSAVDMVKNLCGKGGGREDMAQGGGEAPTDLSSRIKSIMDVINTALA